jgi:energy-coupling factor transporter ATP-binding protein EcfA2
MPLLADYQEQCDAFDALLQPDCQANILLFSGASGSGKTTLVRTCLGNVPEHVTTVPIDLRGSANTVPEIFRRLGSRLGWDHLHTFANQVAALRGISALDIDRNWLVGIGNHIQVVLQVKDPADRGERRAALTASFFTDLQSRSDLLLVAFDTYEKATPEVQDWIAGPFLASVADTAALRALVSGQRVPDPQNITWGGCCIHHPLYGVPEAAHWLPIVDALGRYIPFEHPADWLAGVCHALKGAPKDIMQVIDDLPLKKNEESAA